jgi:hypothetical protein
LANVVTTNDAYAGAVTRLVGTEDQLPVQIVSSDDIAPSWATVLAAGAVSGGTNPTISIGDAIVFADGGELGVTTNVMTFGAGGGTRAQLSATELEVSVPTVRWASAVLAPQLTQDGTAGETLLVQAQSGGGGAGGTLELKGGAGTPGGLVQINSSAGDGDIQIGRAHTTKITTDAGETVDLEIEPGIPWLQIGDTAGPTGILFHAAGAVSAPSVTGSRGGNAALASLLTALASMQLIQDNTTA